MKQSSSCDIAPGAATNYMYVTSMPAAACGLFGSPWDVTAAYVLQYMWLLGVVVIGLLYMA